MNVFHTQRYTRMQNFELTNFLPFQGDKLSVYCGAEQEYVTSVGGTQNIDKMNVNVFYSA